VPIRVIRGQENEVPTNCANEREWDHGLWLLFILLVRIPHSEFAKQPGTTIPAPTVEWGMPLVSRAKRDLP